MDTDYRDPATIDVDEVIANVKNSQRLRVQHWTKEGVWPNVTVAALADEVQRLRAENGRLDSAGVEEFTEEERAIIGSFLGISDNQVEAVEFFLLAKQDGSFAKVGGAMRDAAFTATEAQRRQQRI